ncbi:MAG TPA: anhydro-N-acetylmuramic acid kinase [Candidatus Acidoferrales bacterium]|nr:anhydro-N-acetylmuramic acid kinase [Candidatus Acidoferrales bacterium]
MIVAGVMSGTSLDGIDVAIVDIRASRGGLAIRPLAFRSMPYPKPIREALLGVSNAMTHTATISRLNFLLGELYAEAIRKTAWRRKLDLIGMHGQTIFHEGAPVEYLNRRLASTLQIGEAAVVAERTGVRTISNFRERDIAAGGQGAPLVPLADYLLLRSRRMGRIALNIGGIANITAIPAGAALENVVAFDTGPGNMVIDALVRHMTEGGRQYDRNGAIARRAAVHERLLDSMMSDPYIARKPPKTTGREHFGGEFVNGLVATGIALPDLIATATEFTARSIACGILATTLQDAEVIVSGGGVRNRQIMRRLRELLPHHKVATSADYGIDPDAKEAIAFAVLAYQAARGRPCNLPSATGASRALVLGKSSPAA